jgi:hypothetical protein
MMFAVVEDDFKQTPCIDALISGEKVGTLSDFV